MRNGRFVLAVGDEGTWLYLYMNVRKRSATSCVSNIPLNVRYDIRDNTGPTTRFAVLRLRERNEFIVRFDRVTYIISSQVLENEGFERMDAVTCRLILWNLSNEDDRNNFRPKY